MLNQVVSKALTRPAVTDTAALPGVNVDFSWDIVKNRDSVEMVIATNRVRDVGIETHPEVAMGITNAVQLNGRLEAFVEWNAFYPINTPAQRVVTQHEVVGGVVYFITRSVAIDVRVGTGLTAQANRLVLGAGFAVRR